VTLPLPKFSVERPNDLAGAVRAAAHAGSQYLAGGTDLIVNMRRGHGNPSVLIDLSNVAELGGLQCDEHGARIGAGVTLAALGASACIRERYTALSDAARVVAGPSHRNLATLGGNLCLDTRCIYYNQSEWWRQANGYCLKRNGTTCHVAPQGQRCRAAYSGDLAPALLVHEAVVEVAGPAGRRRMPLAALYRDDGAAHLTLVSGELIVAVHLGAGSLRSAYQKSRVRQSMDFPLAGVAVALATDRGRLSALKVAVTGTNSRPVLVTGTSAFEGESPDAALLQRLNKLVQGQVDPVRTTVTPANYRRLVAAALASRLVEQLAAADPASGD
jgi:4-hydroxybenzoyl-CoA reductase subunit beta